MNNQTNPFMISTRSFLLVASVILSPFLAVESQASPYQVVYCGSDGVSLRTGPGTQFQKSGAVFHQSSIPVYATGAVSGKWIQVTVCGWMVAQGHTKSFMTISHDGTWRINPLCDGFLSMRSDAAVHCPPVGKIYSGNTIREHDRAWVDGKLWIYGSITRWVALTAGHKPLLLPCHG